MKYMLHLTTLEAKTYLLLKKIFAIDAIKKTFALAGGTSLALQIGHRTSIDLEIFSNKVFEIKELEIILETCTDFTFEYYGNNSRMLFGKINEIKCDFVHEPTALLEPFEVHDGVSYYGIKDIAAMKLHAVCGRGKKKDFFDIYALLQLYNKQTLIDWFTQKYGIQQLFFLWRSILYFEDAENDPDIEGMSPYTNNWEEIKRIIAINFS